MTSLPPLGGPVDPADQEPGSALGKWDRWYRLLAVSGRQLYGDATTYYMAAAFLSDCPQVEDWGCGAGGFAGLCKTRCVGIDASRTPFADRIADLAGYRSDVDGILLRHVLEHNYAWSAILGNAVASFRRKLCLVLFTPFAETTRELAHNRSRGVDAPRPRARALGNRSLPRRSRMGAVSRHSDPVAIWCRARLLHLARSQRRRPCLDRTEVEMTFEPARLPERLVQPETAELEAASASASPAARLPGASGSLAIGRQLPATCDLP
jgi:hypothetical protein